MRYGQVKGVMMGKPARHRLCTLLAATIPAIAVISPAAALAGPARAGLPAGLASPDLAAGGHLNLVVNPGAEAGAASAQGWDSVTIPGWQIVRGLPTVVRYGTQGFRPAAPRHAGLGSQLFTGGLGGSAVLQQQITLASRDGHTLRPGTRFVLSGWLGGTATSRASAVVRFLSASGRVLGSRTIGPVGGPGHAVRPGLVRRSVAGPLPPGTASAQLNLRLNTSLRTADGPDGAPVGYNRAVADGLRLSVLAAVRPAAPLRPPAAHVPRYQHVFLFYFENQDFSSLIGDTRRAPYLNSLLPKGSLLANLYAEEHPSDGNYLAVAGGSTFGAPLTDPAESNPLYTIHAPNIGDLINARHETWKSYLQSADGPCDDTVHRSYWDDDLPLMYFADIRDRPAYCAAHVVPLEALHTDLASTATTPNFAWIGANDCADMEGCGIRAGDLFLARELRLIMRSRAWRTQRSLAIITVDEDNYDDPNPPQRIATVMIGSSGVRRGYVSHRRYTHYSLLRTIEAALGTGTLTANDRFAQPVNDVFSRAVRRATGSGRSDAPAGVARPSRPASHRPAGPVRTRPDRTAARPQGQLSLPAAPADATAFVANSGSGTVTPIDLRTRKAERAIKVGANPSAVAAAPDGRTVWVANSGSGTVTPISTATLRAGPPIRVGRDPRALAMTPDGKTLYVANSGSGTVTPISTSTGRAGPPIAVGRYPRAIKVSPDGATAYVLDWGNARVTPISTADNTAGSPIAVGSYPFALAFTPDSSTAYVAAYGSDTVTPINVATGSAGTPIPVGAAPDALAVSPDGTTVYVVSGDTETVTPITVGSDRAGQPIKVGYAPADVAFSKSGSTAYVVNTISGTVSTIRTATGHRTRPISVGLYGYPVAIGIDQAGSTAVVLNTYAGRVCLIDTSSGRVVAKLTVGGSPTAVAFAR
jgi:YVTN family beta-propeller protein